MITNKLKFLFFLLITSFISNLKSSELSPLPGMEKCINQEGHKLAKKAPWTDSEKLTAGLRIGSSTLMAMAGNLAASFYMPKPYKKSSIDIVISPMIGTFVGIGSLKIISLITKDRFDQKLKITENEIADYLKSEDGHFELLKPLVVHVKKNNGAYFIEKTKKFTELIDDLYNDDKRFERFLQRKEGYLGEEKQIEKAYIMFCMYKSYRDNELTELKMRFYKANPSGKHYKDANKLYKEFSNDLSKLSVVYDYLESQNQNNE